MYSFDSKIACIGYHVYRNSTWQNAKPGHKLKVEREMNKLSKSIDPYACAVKIKHQFFDTWLVMSYIPRVVSCHCYFFMKESGNITGHSISITYKDLQSISDSCCLFRGAVTVNIFRQK